MYLGEAEQVNSFVLDLHVHKQVFWQNLTTGERCQRRLKAQKKHYCVGCIGCIDSLEKN